jgi:hypothetical protein
MLISFAKMDKMNAMIALFLLLVAVVYVHPTMVKNLNHTVLGRIILVAIIVYFSVHNTTVGILAALVIICTMQTYIYQEGFDGTGATTTTTTATTTGGAPTIQNDSGLGTPGSSLEQVSKIDQAKVDDLKQKIEAAKMNGPDQLATQQQMQSAPSNTITVPVSSGNGDDVSAASKETFQTLGYSAY